MKITKTLSKLLLILGLTTQQACSQQNKLITYKTDKFTIEYPSEWHTTNENGILNFFPKEGFGAVTISSYSGIDFPLDKTKEFILEMDEVKDDPNNVKMIQKAGIAEFSYEHTEKNLKWVTKAFRKKTDFFLVTINCEIDKWEDNKDTFLKVINTFKLN